MADSFQNEVPKARINLKLDLHTGGASKKMELPLKLLVAGDFSNGQESAQISGREKVNITKNNFDSVLSEYSPKLNLTVKNTLSEDGGEDSIQLTFQSMKDFTPEQVAAQIPAFTLAQDAPIVARASRLRSGRRGYWLSWVVAAVALVALWFFLSSSLTELVSQTVRPG